MSKGPVLLIPLLVALSFFKGAYSCYAEILVLHSGQRVQGKIIEQNKDSLQLDVGLPIALTYFNEEIKQILPDPPKKKKRHSPALVAKAQELEEEAVQAIDLGDTTRGLELMRESLQEQPNAMRHLNLASVLFSLGVLDFN